MGSRTSRTTIDNVIHPSTYIFRHWRHQEIQPKPILQNAVLVNEKNYNIKTKKKELGIIENTF